MSHLDKIGVELAIDDVVAVAKGNALIIGKVIKFTPKMVTILLIDNSGRWMKRSEFRVYPFDIVKIDQHQALIYLLTGDKR